MKGFKMKILSALFLIVSLKAATSAMESIHPIELKNKIAEETKRDSNEKEFEDFVLNFNKNFSKSNKIAKYCANKISDIIYDKSIEENDDSKGVLKWPELIEAKELLVKYYFAGFVYNFLFLEKSCSKDKFYSENKEFLPFLQNIILKNFSVESAEGTHEINKKEYQMKLSRIECDESFNKKYNNNLFKERYNKIMKFIESYIEISNKSFSKDPTNHIEFNYGFDKKDPLMQIDVNKIYRRQFIMYMSFLNIRNLCKLHYTLILVYISRTNSEIGLIKSDRFHDSYDNGYTDKLNRLLGFKIIDEFLPRKQYIEYLYNCPLVNLVYIFKALEWIVHLKNHYHFTCSEVLERLFDNEDIPDITQTQLEKIARELVAEEKLEKKKLTKAGIDYNNLYFKNDEEKNLMMDRFAKLGIGDSFYKYYIRCRNRYEVSEIEDARDNIFTDKAYKIANTPMIKILKSVKEIEKSHRYVLRGLYYNERFKNDCYDLYGSSRVDELYKSLVQDEPSQREEYIELRNNLLEISILLRNETKKYEVKKITVPDMITAENKLNYVTVDKDSKIAKESEDKEEAKNKLNKKIDNKDEEDKEENEEWKSTPKFFTDEYKTDRYAAHDFYSKMDEGIDEEEKEEIEKLKSNPEIFKDEYKTDRSAAPNDYYSKLETEMKKTEDELFRNIFKKPTATNFTKRSAAPKINTVIDNREEENDLFQAMFNNDNSKINNEDEENKKEEKNNFVTVAGNLNIDEKNKENEEKENEEEEKTPHDDNYIMTIYNNEPDQEFYDRFYD